MQNFVPLRGEFDLTGFTSYGHNFDVRAIAFPVRELFSVGQMVHVRRLRDMMSNIFGDYHDLRGLEEAVKDYDVVHSAETAYYCTYQAASAKHKSKWKLVVTVWENIPFLHHSLRLAENKKLVFTAADLFLPVSERAKEALLLEGAPEDKIVVQIPGVDVDHFRPMERDARLLEQFRCKPSDIIVLFAGNLYREKGVFDLLLAFRRLLTRMGEPQNIKLLLAGRGRDGEKLQSMTEQFRLNGTVRFIGSHAYATMPRIHNLADIFVLPSIPTPDWQEQFGYVLAESMSCGKAVISTMSGSIPEVIGNAGMLVPPNDFVSLSSAIESLVSNEPKRRELGQRARERAEDLFDARKVAQSIARHYETVLSK